MEKYVLNGRGHLQKCVYCRAWTLRVWMIESFITDFLDHRLQNCTRCDLFEFQRSVQLKASSHACFECFMKEMVDDFINLTIHYILMHGMDGLRWFSKNAFVKAPSPLLIRSVYAYRPNKTIINLSVRIMIDEQGYAFEAIYDPQ